MINRSTLAALSATRNFFKTERDAIKFKYELESKNCVVRVDQLAVFCDDMTERELLAKTQEIEARILTLTDANSAQIELIRSLVKHEDLYEAVIISKNAAEFWNRNRELNAVTYDDELNGATVAYIPSRDVIMYDDVN